MSARVLIAGVGNIFFGDDGFGVEAIRRLQQERFAPHVRVADFGIRGTHLAYELMDGYDLAILIDALPRGREPGTLTVLEPDRTSQTQQPDAHGMDLTGVFAFMQMLGGAPPRIVIVGCEPASLDEEIALSEPVRRAIEASVPLVHRLLETLTPATAALEVTHERQ